jgi:hypothetical protein
MDPKRQARLDEFRKEWRPAKLRTDSGVYQALCQDPDVDVDGYSAVMLTSSDSAHLGGLLWAKFNGEVEAGTGQKILDLIDVADIFGGVIE